LGKTASEQASAEFRGMIFLIDHNLEGQALIFLGAIAQQGWLDLVTIQFLTFAEVDLPIDSNDRIVWRFAQEKESRSVY